jgi:hypothetical protein
MHDMEALFSVLHVKADGVDDPVCAGDGTRHRCVVIHVRMDRLDLGITALT